MDTSDISTGLIDRLRNVTLFAAFAQNNDALTAIASLLSITKCEAGTAVVKEGDNGSEMYLIGSGTVEIVKKTKPGDDYTVAELTAENNAFFGEMALVDDDKRSASVICKTSCEFFILSRVKFISLGDAYPEIGLAITRELARIVCNRLRKANGDIITLFDALVGEVVESGGLD